MQINAKSSIIASPNSDNPKTESYDAGLRAKPYKRPQKINPIPIAQPPRGRIQMAAAMIFIPTRNTIE